MNIVHFGRIFAAVNGLASFVPLLLMGSGVGGLALAECNLAVYLRCGFSFGCLVGNLRPFFGGFYPIILQKKSPYYLHISFFCCTFALDFKQKTFNTLVLYTMYIIQTKTQGKFSA